MTPRFFLAALLTFLVLGLSAPAYAYQSPWGEGQSRPEDLVISLVTFSPGDSVESWFGHSGLIVEDRRFNVGRLYNYGMFTFDGTMLMRFAMGRLWFWVAPTSISLTYDLYIALDRDVRVLELNIPPEKRLLVAEFLADNVRPENREYLYHHYDDNCATRLRDIIDIAVDGQFSEALKNTPGRWSLREHTRRHSGHLPPMDWVLMFLMSGNIDGPTRVWDEMFLPEELEEQVLNFDWVDEDGVEHPLVLRRHVVYESVDRDPVPEDPPLHWPFWLLFGAVIGAIGLAIAFSARRTPGRSRRVSYGLYHLFVGLLLGFPGLVLGTMVVGTEHTVTYWNQNLFWASPLTLVVVFFAIGVLRGKERARKNLVLLWLTLTGVAAVGVLLQLLSIPLPALYQDTSLAMASMLPIVLGATACAWWVDGDLIRRRTEGEGPGSR